MAIIELKPFGEKFWQVTRDGEVILCAVGRQQALAGAARLLSDDLKDPETIAKSTFVGVEPAEFLSAGSTWRLPRWAELPQVDLRIFASAEEQLQIESVSEPDARLSAEYRAALAEEDHTLALELLVKLGEQQRCSPRFWQFLQQLAPSLLPTRWLIDGRAKWDREAKIALIGKRAKGQDSQFGGGPFPSRDPKRSERRRRNQRDKDRD